MAGGNLTIATRLEFASLDELEAGFADRVRADALFLTRALLGASPDDLYVGAPVHIEIETARGERALSVDGVVAWSYPAAPRTPPGREAGAGIVISRHVDDESQRRAERMLKRPGAGSRVRIPGTRLVVPRPPVKTSVVARPVTIPPTSAVRAPASTTPLTSPPSSSASSSSSSSSAAAAASASSSSSSPSSSSSSWSAAAGSPPDGVKKPAASPFSRAVGPAGASGAWPPSAASSGSPIGSSMSPGSSPSIMAGASTAPPVEETTALTGPPLLPSSLLDAAPTQPPTHHVDDATGELVVPMPPAPQPRVMAMGMFVDQSFDPTPTPRPMPVEEKPAAGLPTSSSTPPVSALPFAALLGLSPDITVAEPPPPMIDVPPPVEPATMPPADSADRTVDNAPRPISIDGLPDAAPAPAAFEQRSTDVDLLQSLDDADFFPAELEEQREKAKQQLSRALTPPTQPALNPALVEETVTSWNQLEDLPSADGDAELISEEEPAPSPAVLQAPLDEITRATGRIDTSDASAPSAPPVEDTTGVHDTHDGNSLNSLPSLDPVDLRTAEQTAINLEPPEHTTAESAAISRSDLRSADAGHEVVAPRPLPELEPFEAAPLPAAGEIGIAFLYSPRRGPEPISALEAFQWPKHGTKRWNSVDAAREDGSEAALDAAVSSSPWLARDPSSSSAPSAFETGHTDPGVRVQDIVGKAVSLAAEEDDSVFSDTGAPVRPAMTSPASPPGVDDNDTLVGETTVDETFSGRDDARAAALAAAAGVDDEAETDRDMKRPPSKGGAAGERERLGVLQRFLGGGRRQ